MAIILPPCWPRFLLALIGYLLRATRLVVRRATRAVRRVVRRATRFVVRAARRVVRLAARPPDGVGGGALDSSLSISLVRAAGLRSLFTILEALLRLIRLATRVALAISYPPGGPKPPIEKSLRPWRS